MIDYGDIYRRNIALKKLMVIAAGTDHRVRYCEIIGVMEALLSGDPEIAAAIQAAFSGPPDPPDEDGK